MLAFEYQQYNISHGSAARWWDF